MTSDATTRAGATSVNYLELTFALMGGAAVWLLRLVVNSSLVEYSCAIDATWPLWATTAVTTLIAVASLVSARRFHRTADDGARSRDGVRWLGLLGVIMNILAIAGILLETSPVLFLDVCVGGAPT